MRYFQVQPEVAGGFGPHTILDTSANRLAHHAVQRLHYVFDGWLGDEIIGSTPCLLVTQRLADSIKRHGLTGVNFDQVEISRSTLFDEMYPDRELPSFVWMKVDGTKWAADLFFAETGRLVVSERAWELMKAFATNAIVSDFTAC